jgi:hypothetical protein
MPTTYPETYFPVLVQTILAVLVAGRTDHAFPMNAASFPPATPGIASA